MRVPCLILSALAVGLLPRAAMAVCVNPSPADLDGVIAGMGLTASAQGAALSGDASMFAELSELGPITPQDGGTMAFLFTGDVTVLCDMLDVDHGNDGLPDGDQAQVSLSLEVPAGAQSLVIEFYFLSREYPEYVGQAYNDTFQVFLTDSGGTEQIVFDENGSEVSVNNALFDVTGATDLLETGFDGHGATGWLQTRTSVTAGETIDLVFSIQDQGDGVLDSGVLIDVVEFSEVPTDGSTTCPDADATNDPDGDDLASECDNCPDDHNPDQADSDGDGIGDACEDTGDTGDTGDPPLEPERWLQGGPACSASAARPAAGGLSLTLLLALGLVARRRTA